MDERTQDLARTVRYLFEGAMLKRTPRTGFAFLGRGTESVAAHTFGMALIAMTLANEVPGIDVEKLLKMCLLHDIPEARTGDANAVHKRYITVHEETAIADMVQGLPFAREISDLLSEYRKGETAEAVIAHDADQLDMLLSLKEHLDTGSADAGLWIPHVQARLKSPSARALAESMMKEHWASWWMSRLLEQEEGVGDTG